MSAIAGAIIFAWVAALGIMLWKSPEAAAFVMLYLFITAFIGAVWALQWAICYLAGAA